MKTENGEKVTVKEIEKMCKEMNFTSVVKHTIVAILEGVSITCCLIFAYLHLPWISLLCCLIAFICSQFQIRALQKIINVFINMFMK